MNKCQILSLCHNDASYHQTITLVTFIVDRNLAQHKFSRQFFYCIVNSTSFRFPFFGSHETLEERPQVLTSLYNRQHDLGSTAFSMRQEAIECLSGFIESFYKSRQKRAQKLLATF